MVFCSSQRVGSPNTSVSPPEPCGRFSMGSLKDFSGEGASRRKSQNKRSGGRVIAQKGGIHMTCILALLLGASTKEAGKKKKKKIRGTLARIGAGLDRIGKRAAKGLF